jgi:hypothetical protein
VDHYLNEHLIPNIVVYTKDRYANYPIQSLLKYRVTNETKLNKFYQALHSNLTTIIDLHTDLIYKNYLIIEMIEACHKNSSLDLKQLVETLVEYFECNSDENRIHFVRVLLIYEKANYIIKSSPLDQSLYSFDLKPIASSIASKLIEYDDKITLKSFNNLNENEIEHLCTNNVGSHFIQQCLKIFFNKDRTVLLQTIFDKIKGRFNILCTNRSGSFVMETLWSVGNLKQRTAIVDELKMIENQLRNDQYARFLMNKIGCSFYRRKPEEWKRIQTNEFKKRKMFSDLFDDTKTNNKLQKY